MILRILLKSTVIFIAAIFVSAFFIACSGITVDKVIKVNPNDWIMAGGSPEQQHVSKYVLAPPLNLMWEYNIEGGVGPTGIAATDAVVFVNALQGVMFTFDVQTGGKIGNLKFLGKDCSTAPLVLGKDVIMTYAGDNKYSLASYNLTEGVINWRKNYGDIQTSPIPKDGAVYFGSLNGNFYKVEQSTGKMIWKLNTKARIHSTCAIGDSIAVLGNDDGYIMGVDLNTGREVWSIGTSGPIISTALISNGIAYLGGDDSIYCAIKIDSGTTIWEINLHTKMIGGSAIDMNGNLITGCVDGSIYSISSDSGNINWRAKTYGTIISSPIVSGKYIYVSSYDSYIYALDAFTGEIVWSTLLENKVKTTPVIWREYLFVAADEIVYCFTNKTIEKKTK